MSERDLWCAVIQMAWDDALYAGKDHERFGDRREARDWFERGGSDFYEVCALAGVNPHAIRDRYHAAMREAAA